MYDNFMFLMNLRIQFTEFSLAGNLINRDEIIISIYYTIYLNIILC